MVKFKGEKGGALVMTLMVSLILSMLGLAILPLTVMEYKTSVNFSDFERAYFLAEAGMEEAIGELDKNWSYGNQANLSIDGNEGSYDIKVEEDGDGKLIKATGKVGNIERTIEAKLEKVQSFVNLSALTDYAIFTQGDLSVEELGNIISDGPDLGIIGVLGDLNFKSAENSGKAYLKVEGNVSIQQPKKAPNYPKNFPTPDKIIDLADFKVSDYIQWLKNEFSGKITSYKASGSADKFDYSGNNGPEDKIFIFEDYTKSVTLGGTINGLIIIKKTKTLYIENKATINGMIIFDGSDIEMTEFQITGNKVRINGSLICTNSSSQKGNWQVELHHNADLLNEHLGNYLPDSYEVPGGGDSSSIKLKKWKEIN